MKKTQRTTELTMFTTNIPNRKRGVLYKGLRNLRAMWQIGVCLLLLLVCFSQIACASTRYVVVVSQETWNDASWQTVATTLSARHSGQVLTYSGTPFPDALRLAIATNSPNHVCFVAQPQEVTQGFVANAHQMLRQLDADPYGDAIWGIVTGLTATDAQALANRAGPLIVDNALMKTAGDWLDYIYSGVYHSESDTGTIWTRVNGGIISKRTDGPLDDTVPLVDGLNANNVDLMVTSGHASEYNWQLHYPTPSPEGYFQASSGQLFGLDSGSVRHDINTSNEKIYYAPGNCLIGHIPEDSSRVNCMALAWLKSGGAAQMAGYVVTTAYGYMGWGVAEYFVKLADRWTFAESCFLNNQALLFDDLHDTPGVDPTAINYDRDVFVLYGDPAYVARLQAVIQPDYNQTLQYSDAGGGATNFVFTIQMNRAVNVGRPVIARLPFRVANPSVTDNAGRTVDVVDDMILVNIWHTGETDLTAGQTWTVRFSTVSSLCIYSLNPTSTNISASEFLGSFGVTTSIGCGWTASTAYSWIHTTSSGTGNGTVNYTVDANTNAARSGTITVEGQNFTINQNGTTQSAAQKGWLYPRKDRAALACEPRGSSERTGTNLVQQFTIMGVQSHVLSGDVDGDGAMEIVTTSGSTMKLYSGTGSLKRTVTLPRASEAYMLEDVNGDGVLDIGLGGNGDGFASYLYKGDGTLLKTFVGQHQGGWNDVGIYPIGVAGNKVLIGYNAGYACTPRGMAAFDYATGTESWYYQVGPAGGQFSVADWDGDGKLDIVREAATVHNGASGNGTTDSDLYLIVTDETGTNRITQMYPSPTHGGAAHLFVDLTGDGKPEILGFESHDPTYYPGLSQIHLYGPGGIANELHTFDGPNNTSWTYAVGNLDGDGSPEIVATATGTQTTYVLDATLSKMKEKAVAGYVQLVCDLNGDGKKEIVLLSSTGTLRVLDKDLNEIASAQAGAQDGEVAASDIDGDGIVELLCRTDKLYVFKPLPKLNQAKSGGNILLSWPTNWTGFCLQYATNLSPSSWVSNSSSPAIVNGQCTVTNTMSDRVKFYRLKK